MAKKKKTSSKAIFVVFLVVVLVLLGVCFFIKKNKQETGQFLENQSILSVTPTVTEAPIVKETMPQVNITAAAKKDTTPPKTYILSPETGAHVRAPVKIVANVTDDVGVERVEFYAGSSDYQLIGIVRQTPFEATWVPSAGFSGYGNQTNIPVYIRAYDTSGNQGGTSISVYLDQ